MTAVNCPMCELRFSTRTERDWHLRNEHQHAHVRPPANQAAPWTRHTPEPAPAATPEPAPAATPKPAPAAEPEPDKEPEE